MSNLGSEAVTVWRKNLKQRAVSVLGGCCIICGYNRCLAALEFHHLDPSHKDFGIAEAYANPKKWETIVDELKKCILVCANCHRELHQGMITFTGSPPPILEEDYRVLEKSHHRCICNVVIHKSKRYCSPECSAKGRQEINWEKEKDRLLDFKDNQQFSYVQIASIYGVSDKTIRKWYLRLKS